MLRYARNKLVMPTREQALPGRAQRALAKAAYGRITTEIVDAPEFYYAEECHQQYLAKNPWGYCGLGGTGVACPVGLAEIAPEAP